MKYLEYEELLENEYIDELYDDDDGADDPAPETEPADTPDENEESPATSRLKQKAKDSAMKTVSKALKQHAHKLSLAGPLGTILLWIAAIIVALIIIIGIIMFLITMPGMVMEKLKTMSRTIGRAFANFFGGDTTSIVSDEEIYDTLTYLEQMNYDLKGLGFLTEFVGLGYDDDNDGEIDEVGEDDDKDGKDDGIARDSDGNITDAISEFIYTYLVSENYVYTIANNNASIWKVGESNFWEILGGFGARVLTILTGGQAQKYWDRGFIKIHIDGGVIGKEGAYFRNDWFGTNKITLDTEAKTLEIRMGHFNNPMTYSLDGWTGRYGIPIDFLIAIHTATNMPDLAYDLATKFETQLLLLLHPLKNNEAIGYYKNDDGQYISYEDFEKIAKTDGPAGLFISREEAKLIMDEYGIKSPDSCIGTADVGEDVLYDANTNIDFQSDVSTKQQEAINAYNAMGNKLKEYGLTTEIAGIPLNVSSFTQFLNVMNKLEQKQSEVIVSNKPSGTQTDTHTYEYYDDSRQLDLNLTWENTTADESYERYSATISLKYDNYLYTHQLSVGSYNHPITSQRKYKATVSCNLIGEWSDKKVDQYLKSEGLETTEGAKCSENDGIEEACVVCRRYVRLIYSELNRVDDPNYKIYQPYISNVKNHWYRDVYFVDYGKTGKEFVKTDYEYEAIMKERWTLYETDANGEYILYEIDENGNYKGVYNGTKEEAEKEGIKVAKKAVTTSISENFEDIGWNDLEEEKSIWNTYAAYAIDEQVQVRFEKVYTEEFDETADMANGIKNRLYVELKISEGVIQTGEGQRTETNPEIKKMFLQNSYFRYDGSPETAEIITKLRNVVANANKENIEHYNGYGPLSDEELELTLEDGENVYKVSEYAGEVVIEQDALNAFSILENTHTLDADYIYRDFKELVVELGYFSKEELTDETPRLLQFLVPEIGSGGYPFRNIDKRENEFGTMIHSKYDIDANKKYTLKELAKSAYLAEDAEDTGEELGVTTRNIETKEFLDNENFFVTYASLSATPMANFANVGAIQDIAEAEYDVQIISGASGKGVKKADLTLNGVNYEVWSQTSSTCTLYSFAFIANAYTGEDFYNYVKATYGTSNDLVNQTGTGQGGNDYWQQGVGFKGKEKLDEVTGGGERYEPGTPNLAEKVAEALGKGIPVYFYGKYLASADQHAIVLLGKADNGVLFYNPGGGYIGICEEFGSNFQTNLQKLISSYFNHWLYIPNVAPEGSALTGTVATYQGFTGNEAVVSPVTGVLLEYGTYEEDDDERVNFDLKYGYSMYSNTSESENAQEGEENSGIQKIVKDKVGYAKILVLDKENYEKFETGILKGYSGVLPVYDNGNQGFLNKDGHFLKNAIKTEEQLEQIRDEDNPNSALDETLYGYKEFAELYDSYGISGYVVYIDGFKCELPDEEFEKNAEMADEEIPDGKTLKLEDFKVAINKLDESNEKIQTLYEQPEPYKLSSKEETVKLNVEEELKAGAAPAITVDDIVFIKEGTVIGRTYTDKEVITKLRNEDISKYIVTSTAEEGEDVVNENKLIGNYLRVMLKAEDEIVENVEDYMKLDEGSATVTDVNWEFYYWLPYESGGIGNQEPGEYKGAGACGTVSGPDEVAVGFAQWTTLRDPSKGTNNIAPLCKWLAEQDPALCGALTTFGSYGYGRICDDIDSLQNAWYSVYDSNPKKFLELQMKYFYEVEYLPWLEDDGVEWMTNKSMVVQGTYASLNNWGPNIRWQDVISESMSDDAIVKALLKKACSHGSTMGPLTARWESQYALARDIINGSFTDVENWVKTKQPLKYNEGENKGTLTSVAMLVNKNWLYADIRKKIYN